MTHKKRLAIYKKMLRFLKRSLPAFRLGFCSYLLIYLVDSKIQEFPELMAYKPKKNYRHKRFGRFEITSYWWSPYNRKKRIQILEEIITSMSKK